MIPRLSTPLQKAIRTTEGVLVVILDGAVAIVSGLDPHTLPVKWAATIIAVQHIALLAQRGAIKAVAIQRGFGVAAPIDDQKLEHTMASIVDMATSIEQVIPHLQMAAKAAGFTGIISPAVAATPGSAIVTEPMAVKPVDDAALAVAGAVTDQDEAQVQPPATDLGGE